MKLSDRDLRSLAVDGFALVPDVFTAGEIDTLISAFTDVAAQDHPANVYEQHSGAVRTAMGVHLRHRRFHQLVHHPRLVGPAHQVLGTGAFYAQQVKVNVKAAHDGEPWQWHYDFATHHHEDGVLEPLALNVHVFLDDVTTANGPLQFIRGSHTIGAHATFLDAETTSYDLWCVSEEVVDPLAAANGTYTATGTAGSVLIFGDTMLHWSPPNNSNRDRRIFSVIYNPVTNAATNTERPDWKHHRDLIPVKPIADGCLSEPA